MPITLGTNISSLRTQRELGKSTESLSRVYERLSSGQRINRASDDAAGLAISSQLNASARVMTQALKNINDGLSLANVAEGALDALKEISQRQLELAEQAANGTYSVIQRRAMNTETNALVDEYNRIAGSTSFNGFKIFDPSLGSITLQAGHGATDGTLTIDVGSILRRSVGDGTFQEAVSFQTDGTDAGSVITGDLNHDGKADIVTANFSSSNVSVFLGVGDGTFQTSATYDTQSGNFTAVVGDVNGDGSLDIVVADYVNGGISVLLNNGNGTFGSAVSFQTNGARPQYLHVTDLNNDGRADIITGGRDFNESGFSVFIGNGNGTFKAASTVATTYFDVNGLSSGDVNGDGKMDVVVAETDYNNTGGGAVGVYLGDGRGGFSSVFNLTSVSGNPYHVQLGDYNGDGYLDIASIGTSTTNDVNIFLGNGNGTFKAPLSIPSSFGGPSGITGGDLNGDGIEDLVLTHMEGNRNGVYNQEISILLGNGDGHFKAEPTYATGGAPWMSQLADFNGDGRLDIVSSDWDAGRNSISVLLANSAFTANSSYLNINTQQGARNAIETATQNLSRIESQLGSIGATTSRLSSALSTLTATRENFMAASSRIQDVDISSESAALVKEQILQQATSAVLAQANQQPALALRLLGGG